MEILKEIVDWYKANIGGNQSLKEIRKKVKEQKEFEERIDVAKHHVYLSDRPNDNGIPYPVICINGTVIYKVCANPRIEKGEISLEDIGEVLTRQRINYAENNLNFR